MPKQERVASIEDLRAVLVVEEGQVVWNLTNDGVSNELANLRSSHSDLAELAGVCTAPGRLDKALEDTRVGDRRERHRDRVGQPLGDLVKVAIVMRIQ